MAAYGQVVLKSGSGINEEYLISNAEKAARFAEAYSDYKRALRALAATGSAAQARDEPGQVLEAKEPVPEESPAAPAEQTASPYEWKSIPFLQNSDATSPQHAFKIMEQFISMLQVDINGFSGTHSMGEFEKFIRTVATVPDVLRTFLTRAPGMAPFVPKLVASITETARNAVEQVRKGLEAVDPAVAAEEDARRALAAAREVEAVLQERPDR